MGSVGEEVSESDTSIGRLLSDVNNTSAATQSFGDEFTVHRRSRRKLPVHGTRRYRSDDQPNGDGDRNQVMTTSILELGEAAGGARRALVEFLWFGVKQARACLFAGLFFVAVFGVPRAGIGGIPRYDLLLLVALAIQAWMVWPNTSTLTRIKRNTGFTNHACGNRV
jgi:hypothetical protein